MRAFVKPITWLPGGWGNGYVVIPEGHELHGLDYDTIHEKIELDVHGDLTFSESADNLEWSEIKPEDKGGWVVGFDTAHFGDDHVRWPDEESVMVEAERLKDQLLTLDSLIKNEKF